MNLNQPEIGDSIRINKLGYYHVGVYVGPQDFYGRCVVHNCKGNGVVLSSLEEFAGGSRVFIHQKAKGDFFQRENVAQLALSLVGRRYDLLNFNCEHAVNLAQKGSPESPQIAAFALLSLLLGCVLLLSGKKA